MNTTASKDSPTIHKDWGHGPTVAFSPAAPHGLTSTHQDRVSADLLAFLRC
jgi:hypothetical protein